jgi:hypothetical protein
MKLPITDYTLIDVDAPVLPAYEAFVDGSRYWLVWCRYCRNPHRILASFDKSSCTAMRPW